LVEANGVFELALEEIDVGEVDPYVGAVGCGFADLHKEIFSFVEETLFLEDYGEAICSVNVVGIVGKDREEIVLSNLDIFGFFLGV